MTLSVNWAKHYKLTFNHVGATGNIPENYYYTLNEQLHDTARLDNPVSNIGKPTKSISNNIYEVSYRFRGYYTQTEGHGLQIINENGDVNSTNVNKITDDITIYAHWTKIGWEYVNKGTNPSLTNQQWKYYDYDGNALKGKQWICPANFDCPDSQKGYWFFDLSSGDLRLGWIWYENHWYYGYPEDPDNNGYVDGYLLANKTAYPFGDKCSHFDEYAICRDGTKNGKYCENGCEN